MKTSVKWSFVAATVPILGCLSGPAKSAGNTGYPQGSYVQTCTDIQVDQAKDTLSARCEKLGGSPLQATTLPGLNQCLSSLVGGGDIANIDGNLICMPDLPIAKQGYQFPVPETVINGWIYQNDQDAINRHGWHIWTGLTQFVGEVDGRPMRAFETWRTPNGMVFDTKSATGSVLFKAVPAVQQKDGLRLNIPKQFHGAPAKSRKSMAPTFAKVLATVSSSPVGDTTVFESVAYNPAAARHAVGNRLFLKATLTSLAKNGYSDIPPFPVSAITIKPVYKVIPADSPNGYYTFPGWPGTPAVAKAFPEPDWGGCVYVNIKAGGPGTGNQIDVGCTTKAAPAPQFTFHVDDFIHEKLTAEDAEYLNQQLSLPNYAKQGDIAILVGMHVTSREIERWTWQTFWWSANDEQPFAPSSAAIAKQRPLNLLDKAAAHYAMATAYQMIVPAQPISGGQSVGEPHIAYNPHLEAQFDKNVFSIHREIKSPKPGQPAFVGEYGVQTNCMTCHNLANFDPKTQQSALGYATDFYMSVDDPKFDGLLRTDFAWSIPSNATD